MSLYYVSYEPAELSTLDNLLDQLRKMNARQILSTAWCIRDDSNSCSKIFDRLSPYIDKHENERLLVIQQDICTDSVKSTNLRKPLFR
jgi:hypothetical protein